MYNSVNELFADEIQEMKAVIANKDSVIANKDSVIASKDTELAEKAAIIANLQAQLDLARAAGYNLQPTSQSPEGNKQS